LAIFFICNQLLTETDASLRRMFSRDTTYAAGDLVADAPIVRCESSWAQVGDRNAFVRCKVKARPKVTAIFWILDGNGTTVTEGQVVNEHWTLVMVGIVRCM